MFATLLLCNEQTFISLMWKILLFLSLFSLKKKKKKNLNPRITNFIHFAIARNVCIKIVKQRINGKIRNFAGIIKKKRTI